MRIKIFAYTVSNVLRQTEEDGKWREEGESIVTEGWLETFDYRYKSG